MTATACDASVEDCPGDDCRHPVHPGDVCLYVVEFDGDEGPCGCRPRCQECDGYGTVDFDGRDYDCKDCDATGEAL